MDFGRVLLIGFVLLIATHECGHVLAARWLGLRVLAIKLSVLSGECHSEFPRSTREAWALYSAGLAAQLTLFLLTVWYLNVFEPALSVAGQCLAATFTAVNLALMMANLVPVQPKSGLVTDGYKLWRLARGDDSDVIPWGSTPTIYPPDTSLLSIGECVPTNFVVGIEILNDNVTSMEFVVDAFVRHLGLTQTDAIKSMFEVHAKGGMLFPLASFEEAVRVAASIQGDAIARNFPLVCRAVNAR